VYYIKVTPFYSENSVYRMAFSSTIVPPGTNVTTLVLAQQSDTGQWASGGSDSTKSQWFKYHVSYNKTYVQFDPYSFTDNKARVQIIYGGSISEQKNMSSSETYSSEMATGWDYYIRVTPSQINMGIYRIRVHRRGI